MAELIVDHPDITEVSSEYRSNYKNRADGLGLLRSIRAGSIAAAFFDPQYRGVLDKLDYGNEGKQRGKARSSLQQMDEAVIGDFIEELNRVLRPSGHLFLWVDKFHLCTGVLPWFSERTELQLVDLITWDKERIGMGYRTRRRSEYCVILQKKPVRAKGVWNLHTIPDVWREKTEKIHPHSKPPELQKQLILATTKEGDFVCDPAAGGYSVFTCCRELGRNFIGGDIAFGEDA
ncbi:MAG: DNA methyltransferase [Eubacteriales bacterium]|nr:DNA methyltransferase [Eubacteriales bacterium]